MGRLRRPKKQYGNSVPQYNAVTPLAAPREPARCRASVIAGRPRPAVGGWTPYRGTADSHFWSAGELWSCCGAVFGLAASAICFDPLEVCLSLLSASKCPVGLISTESPFSLVLHTSMNQTSIRQDQNYGFLYHFYGFEMSPSFHCAAMMDFGLK